MHKANILHTYLAWFLNDSRWEMLWKSGESARATKQLQSRDGRIYTREKKFEYSFHPPFLKIIITHPFPFFPSRNQRNFFRSNNCRYFHFYKLNILFYATIVAVERNKIGPLHLHRVCFTENNCGRSLHELNAPCKLTVFQIATNRKLYDCAWFHELM